MPQDLMGVWASDEASGGEPLWHEIPAYHFCSDHTVFQGEQRDFRRAARWKLSHDQLEIRIQCPEDQSRGIPEQVFRLEYKVSEYAEPNVWLTNEMGNTIKLSRTTERGLEGRRGVI